MRLVVITALWLATWPTLSNAASFDCTKSRSFVEKTICADKELSELDSQLAAVYRSHPSINAGLISDQKNWLLYIRNACQDAACLKEVYTQRLKALTYRKDNSNKTDNETTQPLAMTCSYSDYDTFHMYNIAVNPSHEGTDRHVSTRLFGRNSTKSQDETFIIYPDDRSECIYPSGTQVRVKVGRTSAHPYGMCGGDPEIFLSLWVNQRKIASRVWFSGHCIEDRNDRPEVSFKISDMGKKISISKCHTTRKPPYSEDETPQATPENQATKPLSVCIDLPDLENYLRDLIEYPTQPENTPRVGEYIILRGKELPVCQAFVGDMILESYSPGFFRQGNKRTVMPEWKKPSIQLPDDLRSGQEAIIDIDNDGILDRIIDRDLISSYMDGSVLLIQPGDSLSGLHVSNDPMNSSSSRLFPCQLDSVQRKIQDCPPFSQKGDDAKFTIDATNSKESVTFRARYTGLRPFTFKGENFIGVSSHSEDTLNYSAVLKLLPQQQVNPVCLIKRVVENY